MTLSFVLRVIQDLSEMGVLSVRQGRSDSFLMVRQGKMRVTFVGFMACFMERGSSFYGLPQGGGN